LVPWGHPGGGSEGHRRQKAEEAAARGRLPHQNDIRKTTKKDIAVITNSFKFNLLY
jgi:hypothetical protein